MSKIDTRPPSLPRFPATSVPSHLHILHAPERKAAIFSQSVPEPMYPTSHDVIVVIIMIIAIVIIIQLFIKRKEVHSKKMEHYHPIDLLCFLLQKQGLAGPRTVDIAKEILDDTFM